MEIKWFRLLAIVCPEEAALTFRPDVAVGDMFGSAACSAGSLSGRNGLDMAAEDTVAGLRDRAILSVGLQVGLRRAEIAALKVGDLHQNRGYDSLK
jgi:hypothetical protein